VSAPPRVIVIGGGLAGITAALDCADAGLSVTLLESRGRLGGQAYSFARDGLIADNGQHVFLRCCTDYRALVERIGAGGMVTLQDRLDITVLGRARGRTRRGRLRRSGLPAPLHLAGALLRYPFLTPGGRLSAALAMRALAQVDVEDPANDARTFGDWLREHGQDQGAVQALWDLITRPTVNLSAEWASLAQAAYVFQEGLLSSTAAGDIGHARVPLSEIHDVTARDALGRAGVEVRLRAGVTAIEPAPDPEPEAEPQPRRGPGSGSNAGFTVRLGGTTAEELAADAVVLAVGPERMARLVPAGAGVAPDALRALGASPIVNVHVVYDRPVLDVRFAAGVGTPVQWVFDRTRSAGVERGQYLVVTLSAAEEELAMPSEAVLERYLGALAALLPVAARGAHVERAFVTRDHAATFRAAPGQRALRPAAVTALPGLALAGAHTDTGWPATMEGAVRSGHAAARVVLAAGAPAPRVVPAAGESARKGSPAVPPARQEQVVT
jgi:squalene-associated FAD-dependent desaturase